MTRVEVYARLDAPTPRAVYAALAVWAVALDVALLVLGAVTRAQSAGVLP